MPLPLRQTDAAHEPAAVHMVAGRPQSSYRAHLVVRETQARSGLLDFSWELVALGAFTGGFVSGLSGFGTGLVGMPFWLLTVHPIVAAQLAALSAVISQAQTLGTVKSALTWSHVGPITVAGLIGVPIGVWLLPSLPVGAFKLAIGLTLIIFCLYLLVVPANWRLNRRRRPIELMFGFAGGFMGGLTGVPGPPVIMWGTVQNWSRQEKRAIYQVFILAILVLMLIATAFSGLMTWEFLTSSAIVGPTTIIGAYCGAWVYKRVDDNRFDRIVLVILLMSGIGLIAMR